MTEFQLGTLQMLVPVYQISISDLSFLSSSLALNFEFMTLDFNYGNDHFPTLLTSNSLYLAPIPKRPTIKIGNINWEYFE